MQHVCSHSNAICKDWVAKHKRTTRNGVGNCSSKTGSRRQSDKKTILKHFWKKKKKGKLLAPKLRKSADKSLSQPGCSHSNTIYEIQLQKTIVLSIGRGTEQPWRSHCDAICGNWVANHNRTTSNSIGNCSSKTGCRRQSNKKTILKHFLKGFSRGKLLPWKLRKSTHKSLYRSLDAATPIRFTMLRCKRQKYYACSRGTEQLWAHKVSCSGLLPNTKPMQHLCSHSNAICHHSFKKRKELRTQEQPLVAKHIEGAIRNRNDRSRNRRTDEVPFIAGCSHFTRKNTRFRAPASPPTQSPCNIMQPFQCDLPPQLQETQRTTHTGTTTRCKTHRRNNSRQKRPQPQPPHRRDTFHRRLQPTQSPCNIMQPFQCDLPPQLQETQRTTHTGAKHIGGTIRDRNDRSRNCRTDEVPFIAGCSHFTPQNARFRAPASSPTQSPCNIMQPFQCDLQPQLQETHRTTHTGTLPAKHREGTIRDRNDRSRNRRTDEVPFIAGCSHFTRKNTRFRAPASSPTQSPCNIMQAFQYETTRCKTPWGEQFATETTAAATAAQMRYISSPAAATLHGKTPGFVLRLPPQHKAHATSCSHSNAICHHSFKKRKELRTQEQPLVAKHIEGTSRDRNDRSRNRRTDEVPFVAGCSHFTRQNTRFRAPASSPTQSPCNIMQPFQCGLPPQLQETQRTTHTGTTTRCKTHRNNSRQKRPQPQPPHTRGTFHRRLQPLYTEKQKVSFSGFLPNSPLPFVTTPLHHHLRPFVTASLRHHSPSSPLPFVTTSLLHHLPSSPLPFVTAPLYHHFPVSPLPFVTTSLLHHFPSSPLPFVTTSLLHHFPSSPLPFLTASLPHHFPPSPLPFFTTSLVTTSLLHHFPSSPLPFFTTSLLHHFPSSPLPFIITSLRHHFPSSPLPFLTTPLHHHFPSSPLPFFTTSLPHHLPSSPLPFIITSLRHHFPSSPFPFLTTPLHHHFPSSPLPFLTTSLPHHFPSSPPCVIASYSFVVYC